MSSPTKNAQEELAEVHKELVAADELLFQALTRRADAMCSLKQLREGDSEGFYPHLSFQKVLDRARAEVTQLPQKHVDAVVREVLGVTRELLLPITVAYAGVPGSFAHLAARHSFGTAPEFRALDTVGQVLAAVAEGRVGYGVVPFETSTDGVLTQTLHGLVEFDITIRRELTLSLNRQLLSKTGNANDIDKIYGTPQALSATERFLRRSFPNATLIDVPAEEVACQFVTDDHGSAAIGNRMVSEMFELSVVQDGIDDDSGTLTRFAVVGGAPPKRSGKDRTVLALAVRDEPGALYKALAPLAGRSINLTRLESRPSASNAFRFVFFVELDGHVTDRSIVTAMEELRLEAKFLKVLGSYPQPEADHE